MKGACLVCLSLFASCSAFAPAAARPAVVRRGASGSVLRATPIVAEIEAQDMWWGDKEYPPSIVLGIGKDVPSVVFGLSSGIALGVGVYCVAQSNLLNILSGSTVNGWLVLGSLLVPYSWGLHVASWIQKQNGSRSRIERAACDDTHPPAPSAAERVSIADSNRLLRRQVSDHLLWYCSQVIADVWLNSTCVGRERRGRGHPGYCVTMWRRVQCSA